MEKPDFKTLSRKEKNAHNMIRIPAWVYGGILVVYGGIYSLIYLLLRFFNTALIPMSEDDLFVTKIMHEQMRIFQFSPLLLMLGIGLLLIGFLYYKWFEKLRQILLIMLGAVVFILVFIGFHTWDMMDTVMMVFAEEEPEFSEPAMIFMRFVSIIGLLFALGFLSVPFITGLVGEKRLRKMQDDSE